jgi:hypothetical protein
MGKTIPKSSHPDSYFHDIPTENITEKLIHHLWAEKVFGTYPLKILGGRNVSINFPGFWNRQEGPDFKQSVIKIGDKSLSGDIEIHLYSSDWYRHNHQKDPRYNDVILHVAVWADDEAPCANNAEHIKRNSSEANHPSPSGLRNDSPRLNPCSKNTGYSAKENKNDYVTDSNGRKIPQLIIADWLAKEYEEIDGFLDATDCARINAKFGGIGDCSRYCLNEAFYESIKRYLQALGEKRFDYKLELFKYRQSLLVKHPQGSLVSDYDELAYQGIMEALGYQHNSKAFYELAKALPLGLLNKIISEFKDEDKPLLLQSLFLYQANLVPTSIPDNFDNETRKYLLKTYDLYQKALDIITIEIASSFRQVETPRNDRHCERPRHRVSGKRGNLILLDGLTLPPRGKLYWRFKGTRPINYPQRRLAGISYFLSQYLHQGIFNKVINNYSGNKNSSLLNSFNTDSKDEYWTRHSTFGGKKFKKETPLVGKGTLRTIEINVIFPLLSLYAESTGNKQLEEIINKKLRSYPKLPDNHITRSMKYRLFADKTKMMGKFVRTAFDQQSLIQLFKDFCAKGMEGCKTCGLIRAC